MFWKSFRFRRGLALALICAMLAGNLTGLRAAAHEDVSSMTDQTFFGQWDGEAWITEGKLNYSLSGMQAVEEAVKASDGTDYAAAKEALLAYYRIRTTRTVPEGTPYNPDAWPTYALGMMARLETDGFHFSSPAEYPADIVTVSATPGTVAANVLDGVNESLRQTGQITFLLMGRYQSEDVARIHSRESGDNGPTLMIEDAAGVRHSFAPTKDAVIQSGDEQGTNFGAETALEIKTQGNPASAGSSRAYITFDISALGTVTAKAAQLALYGAATPGDCELVVLKSGNGGYLENEITWENTIGVTYSWQGVEGGTDWKTPAYAQAQYSTDLCRFEFAEHLYTAYLQTKDEQYADSLIWYFLDYIKDQGNRNPVHESALSTGIRAEYAVKSYHYLKNSPSMGAAANTALLKYFWQMGNGLKDPKNFDPTKNFGQFQTLGLYNLALYFPEFKDASKPDGWLQLAKNRLALLMETLIQEDGSYTEPSAFYTVGFANTARKIKKMALVNHDELGEVYDTKLKALARYVMDYTMPNGFITPFGDSDTIDATFLLEDFAEDYPELADLRYVATGGQAGTKPAYTSVRYPDGKMAFLKTGYTPDDLFMSINQGVGNHMHPDLATVTAYAYGRELLVDPGRYSYNKDAVSTWLYNTTQAHNTITIDGKAQTMNFNEVSNFNEWAANDGFDFFEGTHGGYANFWHDRDVLFLRGEFWIVSDYVVSRKGGNHTYQQTWHTLPAANPVLDEVSKTVKTTFAAGANLQIVPADPTDLAASLDDGYYSPQMGSYSDAKYASYTKSGSARDNTFDTVLYPTREGDPRRVEVSRVPIFEGETEIAPKDATALKIELDASNGGDVGYYYLSRASSTFAKRAFAELAFDGKVAYVEENAQGKLTQAALTKGSQLLKGETQLVRSEVPLEDLGITWNADVLELTGAKLMPGTKEAGAMAIYAPDTQSVRLNGKEIAFEKEGDFIYAIKDATTYPVAVETDGNGTAAAPDAVLGGDSVRLQATANPGYVFDGWTGDVQYLDDPARSDATLTMPRAAVSLRANFVRAYTLTAQAGVGGSLLSQAQSTVRAGAEISLRAQAAEGYAFAGWTATGGAQTLLADARAAETTITMGEFDCVVTANFSKEGAAVQPLHLAAQEGGRITSVNLEGYAPGETVAVSAEADAGYAFVGWEAHDGVVFADAFGKTTRFTMPDAETTVTATFTAVSAPLTVIKAWEFDHDADGFELAREKQNLRWEEGGFLSDKSGQIKHSPEVIAAADDLTFPTSEAVCVVIRMKHSFAQADSIKLWYNGTVHTADHGYVLPLRQETGYVDYMFDMTGAEGADWLGDGSIKFFSFSPRVIGDNGGEYSTDYIRILNENVTSYRLHAQVQPGGRVEPLPQYLRAGDKIALSAAAYPGYRFTGWTADGGSFIHADASATVFTAPAADVTLRAGFVKIHTVVFMADGVALSTQQVDDGQPAAAPEAPDKAGYRFDGWDKTFAAVTGDLIVNAVYRANASGGVTVPPAEDTVQLTGTVQLDASGKAVVTVAQSAMERAAQTAAKGAEVLLPGSFAQRALCGLGVLQGADGRLLPEENATRAQMAGILYRLVR